MPSLEHAPALTAFSTSVMATAALLVWSGCARLPDAQAASDCRWLLTTRDAGSSPDQVARELARRAGVPAHVVAAMGPRLYLVALDGADAAQCRQAADRIAADTAFAAAMDRDGRRSIPSRPSASAAL